MKMGKMDDYREGELHQCGELKGRLVYPAEIEATGPSERGGKWHKMNAKDRDGDIVCKNERCRGGI